MARARMRIGGGGRVLRLVPPGHPRPRYTARPEGVRPRRLQLARRRPRIGICR